MGKYRVTGKSEPPFHILNGKEERTALWNIFGSINLWWNTSVKIGNFLVKIFMKEQYRKRTPMQSLKFSNINSGFCDISRSKRFWILYPKNEMYLMTRYKFWYQFQFNSSLISDFILHKQLKNHETMASALWDV